MQPEPPPGDQVFRSRGLREDLPLYRRMKPSRSALRPGKRDTIVLGIGLTSLVLVAFGVFALPRLALDQRCVSPQSLGTVLSGEQNGGTISVAVGSTVTVRIAGFSAPSSVYAESSDVGALKPTVLCSEPRLVSSSAVGVVPFKATADGRSNLVVYTSKADPAGSVILRVTVLVTQIDRFQVVQLMIIVGVAAALVGWYFRAFDIVSGRRKRTKTLAA